MKLTIDASELIINPATRIPICLVLDTSGSMTGEPISRLNQSIQRFIEDILSNDVSRAATDLALITFGSRVNTLFDFQNVGPNLEVKLAANGKTQLGEAVSEAHRLIDRRIKTYQNTGVEYYRPWIILLTDGAPTDDIESAVAQTVKALEENMIYLFAVGVGDYSDMEVLKRFSPQRTPLVLGELKFTEFFSWLRDSIQRVSESLPGEEIKLPPVAPWKDVGKKELYS